MEASIQNLPFDVTVLEMAVTFEKFESLPPKSPPHLFLGAIHCRLIIHNGPAARPMREMNYPSHKRGSFLPLGLRMLGCLRYPSLRAILLDPGFRKIMAHCQSNTDDTVKERKERMPDSMKGG